MKNMNMCVCVNGKGFHERTIDKSSNYLFISLLIFFLDNIRGVSGEYQGRIRTVSGPYQDRIRAVSGPYQGSIRIQLWVGLLSVCFGCPGRASRTFISIISKC